MMISVDAKKKNLIKLNTLYVKGTQQLGIKENHLNITKAINKKPAVNIT